MPLTEKTLELNITYEILREADRLWDLIQSHIPVKLLRSLRLSSSWWRPPAAVGLSLDEEARRGWDVRIDIPIGFHPGPRCIFVQFKLGRHRRYSTHSDSPFFGSIANSQPFCAFGINNNSRLDQHVILAGLAKNRGQEKAVYYALPRIPTQQAFRRWIGRLSHMTSWLSVAEIDRMARVRHVRIHRGQAHELRLSYNDLQRELRSDAVDISEIPDAAPTVIAELTATRAWAILVSWREQLGAAGESVDIAWNAVAEAYLRSLAAYWGIAVTAAATEAGSWREYTLEGVLPGEYWDGSILEEADVGWFMETTAARCYSIFLAIITYLTPYLNAIHDGSWLYRTLEPPPAAHSLPVRNIEGRIAIDPEAVGVDPEVIDWSSVTYQVF